MWIIFSLTLWISWTEFRSLLPWMRGIFSYKLIHWLEQTFVTGMWCSNRVSHCQEAVTALPTSLMVNSTFSLPLPNTNVRCIKSHGHHLSLAASGFKVWELMYLGAFSFGGFQPSARIWVTSASSLLQRGSCHAQLEQSSTFNYCSWSYYAWKQTHCLSQSPHNVILMFSTLLIYLLLCAAFLSWQRMSELSCPKALGHSSHAVAASGFRRHWARVWAAL